MLVSISKLAVREILVRFLNIKFQRTEDKIKLSQRGYVEKLLKKFNLSESKTLETPFDFSLKLKISFTRIKQQ